MLVICSVSHTPQCVSAGAEFLFIVSQAVLLIQDVYLGLEGYAIGTVCVRDRRRVVSLAVLSRRNTESEHRRNTQNVIEI